MTQPNLEQMIAKCDEILGNIGNWATERDKEAVEYFEFITAVRAALTAQGLPERDQSKPAEQQGIFRKFEVSRVDGSDALGGKHHNCEYFVLDITHDPYALNALDAYAKACSETHQQLSVELARKTTQIRNEAIKKEIAAIRAAKDGAS